MRSPGLTRMVSPGAVMGARSGATTLLAIRGGDTVTVPIEVSPGPPARITLVPSALRLAPGEGSQVEVTVTDALGNPVLSPEPRWSSNAGSIAQVDQRGFVRAGSPGTAVIRASAAEVWNQVTVEVSSVSGDPIPGQPEARACAGPAKPWPP